MHFEVLTEDISGKKALEILLKKIIGAKHTFKIVSYKGIGRIPKNLKVTSDPTRRFLLDQLPRLLRGYGKTYLNYPSDSRPAIIVVCDLDNRCLKSFRDELYSVLDACDPAPLTRFCITIEEGEAWYLGDTKAIKCAYPKAKTEVLKRYKYDSICGTWELLAEAIYPGGSSVLTSKGWQAVGAEKSVWAETITLHMDIHINKSPSFCYFRNTILSLI